MLNTVELQYCRVQKGETASGNLVMYLLLLMCGTHCSKVLTTELPTKRTSLARAAKENICWTCRASHLLTENADAMCGYAAQPMQRQKYAS